MNRCRVIPLILSCAVALTLMATSVLAQPAPADSLLRAWLDRAADLYGDRQWTRLDSVAANIVSHVDRTPQPDSSSLALALYYRGQARWAGGMFGDRVGEKSLLRCLGLFGRLARPDTARWVMTHHALARLLTETDRADSALIVAASGRKLCPPAAAGGDSLLALLWGATGRGYRRSNQYDLAIAAYDSALVLRKRRHGHEHPLVAETMAEIGGLHGRAYRLHEAKRLLDEAVAILERTSGPEGASLVTPLSELSFVESALGNIARSIEILERAAAIIASVHGPSSPRLIPPIYNIGLRLSDFGDYQGAYAVAAALLPRAESALGAGNSRTETVRYLAGAMAIMGGDTAAAAVHLTRAREYLLAKPIDAAHVSNLIERFYSILLVRRGDLAGARRVVDEGLERELRSGQPLTPVLFPLLDQLATVQMAMLDSTGLDNTLRVLDEHFGEASGQESFVDRYLRARARCELWRGRRDIATAFALRSEESDRRRLLNNVQALPDARALQLASEISEGLDILVRNSDAGEPAIATAWDRVIRWRGLVTAELAARRAPSSAGTDTTLAKAHTRWVEALQASAQLEILEGGRPAALAARRAAAENAERRYGAIAMARGVPLDTAVVDLARVRGALGAEEALVSIVSVSATTDSARYIAFVTQGADGQFRRLDLGIAQELSLPIRTWRAALATPPAPGRERDQESDCRKLGLQVRARTWDRIAPAIAGARTVILVADGELADLPWQALPGAEDRYLVEEPVEIQTPAAERELLPAPGREGRGLLALGDPDYNRPAASGAPMVRERTTERMDSVSSGGDLVSLVVRGAGSDCGSASEIALDPLPGARAEVEWIARAWNATHAANPAMLLLGAKASERAFKENAPGQAVLHVATHGILLGRDCTPVYQPTRGVGGFGPIKKQGRLPTRPRAPAAATEPLPLRVELPPSPWNGQRVWLALAGANRRGAPGLDNDGLLTADEVVTLDLSGVDWVVLSACQSGVGYNWPLEGSAGIRRAFRLAGAGSVIASQWSIADESTREWMQKLYSARAVGRTTAAGAMRTASRAVLQARRAGGRTTHPFHWAAFTATGR